MTSDPTPPRDPHLAGLGNFALTDLIARILETHKIDGAIPLKKAQVLAGLQDELARRVDAAVRSAVGKSTT